jgi:hypothetical protein
LIKNSVATLSNAGDLAGVANITVAGKITGLVAPVDASDAANKSYVDSAVSGLKYKEPVKAASTADVPVLSGLLTIDDVPLSATDRVLLKDQNTGAQNGIYVVAVGPWSRAADLQSGASAKNAAVIVISGTANGKDSFVCTNAAGSDVVGTHALTFVMFQTDAGGDVIGPGTTVDNSVARFDSTTGKLIQSSDVTISDTADIAGVKTLALHGASSGILTLQAGATTTNHLLTLPDVQGAAGSVLENNGSGGLSWSTSAVKGPAGSTDNAVARFDQSSGALVQNSGVTIGDSDDVAGVTSLSMDGAGSGTITIQPAANTDVYTLTMPENQGSAGTYLANDGSGGLSWTTPGDISGPVTSTDNAIARYDLTSGKLLQNSGVTISDASDIAGVKTLAMNGYISGALTLQPSDTTTDHSLIFPPSLGSSGTYLKHVAGGVLSWDSPGNVAGPSSSTDNAVARFDLETGRLIQNSGIAISDNADLSGAKSIAMNGASSGTLTLQPANVTSDYSLSFPANQGAEATYLKNDGSGVLSWSTAGDISGPSSSTNHAVARYDLTSGKKLINSGVTISDTADVAGAKTLAMNGLTSGTLTIQPAMVTTDHSLTLPGTQGSANTYLKNNGAGSLSWGSPGDVIGPPGATISAIPRFDTNSGKLLKNSGVLISDANDISNVYSISMTGLSFGVMKIQPAPMTIDYTVTMPSTQGATDTYLKNDGAGSLTWSSTGITATADITAIGYNALLVNTATAGNTAVGARSLDANTTGTRNTAIGEDSLGAISTNSDCTAVGYNALLVNTGARNTAIGSRSLDANTTGEGNTAIGRDSLGANTIGFSNVAIGNNSLLFNVSGSQNVAIGTSSLIGNGTGSSNTAIGFSALSESNGSFNAAFGDSAGLYTTGSYNTAIGALAMSQAGLTGNGNIQIGGLTNIGDYSPCFTLGSTNANRIVMGSSSITNAYVKVSWSVTSDARDKTDFGEVPHGLDFVNQLTPVSFRLKKNRTSEEATGPKRYGFKAQDVLALEGDDHVIIDSEDSEKLQMTDSYLIPVLVNALKEMKNKIDHLESRVRELER